MIKIGSHCIGRDQAPFVVAEMSGNHNQSLDRAFWLGTLCVSSTHHGEVMGNVLVALRLVSKVGMDVSLLPMIQKTLLVHR